MLSISFIIIMLISIFIQTHGQLTCASGWVQNEGKCYLIPAFNSGSQLGTWDQCNAYCPTIADNPGATMLCVRTEDENKWIKETSRQEIWIGYTDMPPFGEGKGTKKYGWVKGCNSTYTNWAPGEPNNSGGTEDFAYIYFNSGNNGKMERCKC